MELVLRGEELMEHMIEDRALWFDPKDWSLRWGTHAHVPWELMVVEAEKLTDFVMPDGEETIRLEALTWLESDAVARPVWCNQTVSIVMVYGPRWLRAFGALRGHAMRKRMDNEDLAVIATAERGWVLIAADQHPIVASDWTEMARHIDENE